MKELKTIKEIEQEITEYLRERGELDEFETFEFDTDHGDLTDGESDDNYPFATFFEVVRDGVNWKRRYEFNIGEYSEPVYDEDGEIQEYKILGYTLGTIFDYQSNFKK